MSLALHLQSMMNFCPKGHSNKKNCEESQLSRKAPSWTIKSQMTLILHDFQSNDTQILKKAVPCHKMFHWHSPGIITNGQQSFRELSSLGMFTSPSVLFWTHPNHRKSFYHGDNVSMLCDPVVSHQSCQEHVTGLVTPFLKIFNFHSSGSQPTVPSGSPLTSVGTT